MFTDDEHDPRNREFVRLLVENERRLERYVHVLIPSWQDAEDVVQNTKLRLWEQFDSFRPEGDFAAWAIRIAHFMVLAYRKRHQRQRVCFSNDLLEKIAERVREDSTTHDDRTTALVECMKALSDASCRLLNMFCTGKRKIKDLANELERTPSAIYSSLFRIRWSLFECVEKRLKEEQEP